MYKLRCFDVIKTNEGKFGPYQVTTRTFRKRTEESNVGADVAVTIECLRITPSNKWKR